MTEVKFLIMLDNEVLLPICDDLDDVGFILSNFANANPEDAQKLEEGSVEIARIIMEPGGEPFCPVTLDIDRKEATMLEWETGDSFEAEFYIEDLNRTVYDEDDIIGILRKEISRGEYTVDEVNAFTITKTEKIPMQFEVEAGEYDITVKDSVDLNNFIHATTADETPSEVQPTTDVAIEEMSFDMLDDEIRRVRDHLFTLMNRRDTIEKERLATPGIRRQAPIALGGEEDEF